MILLMACARMDEEVLPEHIRRSFGNNYKQNKKQVQNTTERTESVHRPVIPPVQTLAHGLGS